MDIFTLVKAGIKNRWNVFLGFTFLTMIMVVCVITMLGVRKNYNGAKDTAYAIEDKGVIAAEFYNGNFSDKLKSKLEANDKVDHLEIYDVVIGNEVKCNDHNEGNSYYFMKNFGNLPIFNEDSTGFVNYDYIDGKYVENDDDSYKLKSGEIYLSYGLKDRFDANAGDKLTVKLCGEIKTFTIKGFVQEPMMGSDVIGLKMVFISDEDFDSIYSETKSLMQSDDDNWMIGDMVFVHPTDKANESSDILLRELNIDTKINDMAFATMTRETSEHYTGIFINIIMAMIVGVTVVLLVIFLIVAGHSITTELEIDYKDLGILKSQGATSSLIRKVYIAEYLVSQLIGCIIGFAVSIPCERMLSDVFFGMTGMLPERNFPVVEGILLSVGLFVITGIYIFFITRRVVKTTPVKAITSGHNDFYFDSRYNARITKRGLGFTLGLRQITSAPKRYISILIVSSLLIFAAITMELMSNYVTSRDALASMGFPISDIEFSFKDSEHKCKVKDVENIINKYTEIEDRVYKTHAYVSVNGESILAVVKAYPDDMSSAYKGREVKYDNEIVITEQVSKLLDINIGDTISLGRYEKNEDVVVVGIFQSMADTGKCISMSLEAFSRMRKEGTDEYTVDHMSGYGVILKDASAADDIVKEVEDKYGDELEIEAIDYEHNLNNIGENFYGAADASRYLIYGLSLIFALVTVLMVCTKVFIQERTDIGIMRAVGFTVPRIRRQFAARFVIISLIGGIIGAVLARLYSGQLMESVFSMFGVQNIELDYSFLAFAKPIILFIILYMVFGYLSSRKVKKVSARELISE